MRFRIPYLTRILWLVCLFASQGRAIECPVREIGTNASSTAALTANDCRYKDVIAGSRSNVYVQAYSVSITGHGVLTIRMTSEAFPPCLYLFDDRFFRYEATISPSAANSSEITIGLTPGQYLIIATSISSTPSGPYSLSTSWTPSPTCVVEELAENATISSQLGGNDCRYLDVFPPSMDASPVKLYRITAPELGIWSARMQSAAFPKRLVVMDDKAATIAQASPVDEADRSELTVSLARGSYLLAVGAQEGGAGPFALTISREPLRPCEPTAAALNATATGAIRDASCRYLDLVAPSTDVSLIEPYSIRIESDALVQIDLNSRAFDGYLTLVDSRGKEIASNDDGGGGTDSKILTSLAAGTYRILVRTAGHNSGTYVLTVASQPLRLCGGAPLNPNDAVEGLLMTDGCRFLDAVIPSGALTPVERHSVVLPDRGVLRVTMSSAAAPAILSIYDSSWHQVAATAGTLDHPDASVAVLLPSDRYTFLAGLAEGRTGGYLLKSLWQPPKDCAVEALSPNGRAAGTFTASDCALRDILVRSLDPTRAKQYHLSISEPGSVVLSAASTETSVVLILVKNDEQIDIASGRAAPARIQGSIAPGEYTILVMPAGGLDGNFTLWSQFTPVGQ